MTPPFPFIPRKLRKKLAPVLKAKWFVFLSDLQVGLVRDHTSLIAAGLAFYFLIAAFPALAAVISIYGIFSNPHVIDEQINLLSRFLPPDPLAIVADQARTLAASGRRVLGASLLVSILIALYSATKGVRALIGGLNIAFNAQETRSAARVNVTALILTCGLMVYFVVSLAFIAGIPVLVHLTPVPHAARKIMLLSRWPLLLVLALIGLEVLYRYAPARARQPGGPVSAGAVIATLLWLGMSCLFSLFVTNFGRYNQIYGSLGAAVILLLWFWLSAYIILLGAEINILLHPDVRPRHGDGRLTH